MNLALLKQCAKYFATFQKIHTCRRIGDNLILLKLDNKTFYIDLARQKSGIFCPDSESKFSNSEKSEQIISEKKFNAPFDLKLKTFCNAKLESCHIDGDNRILRIIATPKHAYKRTRLCLELELTGKYTNAIILDENRVVLAALRHIAQGVREVRVGQILKPLPQPKTIPKISTLEESENFKKLLEISESNNFSDFEFAFKNILNYEFSRHAKNDFQARKNQQIAHIDSKILELKKILENLPRKEDLQLSAIEANLKARSILACVHTLEARQIFADFEVPSVENPSQILKIQTLGAKSFSELAQMYFSQGKRAAQKAKNLHLQIQNLNEKIEFLNAKKNLVMFAQNINDLQIFSQKSSSKNAKKIQKNTNFEIFFIDGFKVGVGRNERQNIALLKAANAQDLWLHITEIPSSHMIIFCGKSKVSEQILQKSAQILVSLSGVKSGNFRIDYTRRSFVKITQGANVVYAKYQSVSFKA